MQQSQQVVAVFEFGPADRQFQGVEGPGQIALAVKGHSLIQVDTRRRVRFGRRPVEQRLNKNGARDRVMDGQGSVI